MTWALLRSLAVPADRLGGVRRDALAAGIEHSHVVLGRGVVLPGCLAEPDCRLLQAPLDSLAPGVKPTQQGLGVGVSGLRRQAAESHRLRIVAVYALALGVEPGHAVLGHVVAAGQPFLPDAESPDVIALFVGFHTRIGRCGAGRREGAGEEQREQFSHDGGILHARYPRCRAVIMHERRYD